MKRFPNLIVWIRFLRLENVLMVATLMLIIRFFVLAPVLEVAELGFRLSLPDFLLLILDVVIVTITGYWINDFHDREIDAINRPERLFPSGKISHSKFWLLYSITIAIGLAITIYLGLAYDELDWVWLYPFSVFAFILYAWKLKRMLFLGNVLVSVFIAAIVFITLLAEPYIFFLSDVLSGYLVFSVLLYFSIIAFFSNLSRELVKDCEDLKGDVSQSVKSIPAVFGFQSGMRLAAFFLVWVLVFEVILLLRLYDFISPVAVLSFALIGVAALVLLYLMLSIKPGESLSRLSVGLKVLMLLGLVQLIVIIQGLEIL